MKTTLKAPIARLIAAGLIALAAQPAAATGPVVISSTPLATAGGSSVLPNLLFVLDASGSMDSDFLPDYVDDGGKCMTRSGGSSNCTYGDPPRGAGGATGFNGVAYDPMFAYKPGLTADGKSKVGASSLPFGSTFTTTAVDNDAYGVQFTGQKDITAGVQDVRYCNANSVCKRNGADNSGTPLIGGADAEGVTHPNGRFPYRSHRSNSSTAIFGLPEMMAIGSFSRSGSTVTATTIHAHGLATNDWIFVTGGSSGINTNAVQVTVATANSFTYTSGSSGTIAAGQTSYRRYSTGTVTRAASATRVDVNSPAHGLVNNDVVTILSTVDNTVNSTSRTITVDDADNFHYTQSGGTTTVISPAVAAFWVRNGLYNSRGTVNGPATSYYIIPIEYCSDANLSDCVAVAVGATPPAGFTFPAYVRFCQTQEQAVTPGLVSDSSGTPRCRGKFVGSGSTQWTWPRYGYFQRDTIESAVGTYARVKTRADCSSAPSCTYAEEIQNFARWWAYYRTRMQMMKTASGRAFLPFVNSSGSSQNDKLRVGFITINPFYAIGSGTNSGSVQANRYLKIAPFVGGSGNQADQWYTMFYLQDPNQSTPLREALSRAGWIFAGKLNTGLTAGIPVADDPVEQACQRHFTLLTTDGYWNGNSGQNILGGAIGNLDNGNPLTDNPYTQPSVDRTSTGTFDGGKGTVVKVVTPSTTTEQVICTAGNNTVFSTGTQTACGCNAGEHRIKQRITTNTQTITTTDGIETGNTTVPTYAYSNITGCSNVFVQTTATPNQRLEQVLCTGSNTTTFGSGTNIACTCPANQKRVLQQTGNRNHNVQTTDGSVTSDTQSAYAFSYQNITGCDAQVTTTIQTSTHQQRVLCSGNATTAFTAGTGGNWGNGQTSCGCSPNFKAVIERNETRTTTNTTIDGVVQPTTFASSDVFSTPTACNALVSTTHRPGVTITQTMLCTGNSTVTFPNGQNVTCGCGTSGRKVLIRQTLTGVDYITGQTFDGVSSGTFPQYAGGYTTAIAYSVNNSVSFSGTAPFPPTSGCATSGSTQTAVGQAISGPASTVTVTGSTVVGPVPPLSTGIQVNNPAGAPTTTGTTITSASFTLPVGQNPKIVDPSGAATVTTTGTPLTIALSPNPGNPVVGSSTTTTTLGGYPDTLADVAMYYYRTDLRGGKDPFGNTSGPANNAAGVDVSANIVPAKTGAKDFVTHQHMVTFSVGLADGLMRYQADYETASGGDFASIKNGTNNGCFWVSGTCNWPQPIADDASALDDLWHAAVNGRGQFYLALNADALSTGIQTALTAVNAQVAAAAASATSSPNVTQTDNQIFSTTYETNTWSGKVFAQTIDPATGNVNPTIQWQADGQLVAKTSAASDSRVIYTLDPSSGNLLKSFEWANLTATEQAFFLDKCVPASTMTQCTGLVGAQLTTANDGASLVGFLRGWQGNEGTIFRDRTYIDTANNNAVVQTVLGDTISAKPAYLRKPQFNYADSGYSAFLSANSNRSPRVYVAANDGYLHAFHGDTGEEVWAYLPRFLMPDLYLLADTGYGSRHRYFADGSPETGDVFDVNTSQWRSILVAGVSGGGRGFYALDITDPDKPQGLWEICSDKNLCDNFDPDLGNTYGNPIMGKLKDGTWVVVVTSGLNNIGPTGDGVGYFFILDAITGKVLDKASTATGDIFTPSGLMKMSAFYDSALTDATFTFIYGGDQLGNVWRLDTSSLPSKVTHLALLTDSSSPPRAQPITTRPSLTRISGQRVLYIGTGRYLGKPDLSDPGAASLVSWQQTLWAFKDQDTDYKDLRTNGKLVQQVLLQLSPTTRGLTTNPVNWSSDDGWYIDFNPVFAGVEDSPGEGVNLVDPRLVLGTLVVTTNVPAAGGSSCSVGGSSFEYNFDFKTGSAVATSQGGVVGRSLGGTITVGVAIVQLPSGAIKSISTGADTSKTTSSVNTSATGAAVRRFSYRVR